MNIFLSRPNWVSPPFAKGLDGFLGVLDTLGLQPKTIGTTTYPSSSPLEEVVRLFKECSGAIILGYPQISIQSGQIKDKPIKSPVLLATEWNHLEAGLAYAYELPILVIHHTGVQRGIFDRGAMPNFIHEVDLTVPNWPLDKAIQGALKTWKSRLRPYSPNLLPKITTKQTTIQTLSKNSPASPRTEIIYCRLCGAAPGKPTSCPNYMNHSFVKSLKDVYCRLCGMTGGGEPTKCPGYMHHSFVTY